MPFSYKHILLGVVLIQCSSLSMGQECDIYRPNIADPWIQKFGDLYYMVGTPCPGDWEMQWVGLWKSRDMVNWSGPVMVFEGEERDRPMWASEIHRMGDDYYIITTCNTWNPGNSFVIQKAPAPDGPYSHHTFLPKRGLDPSIFTDTDGQSYLLDSEWIAPLDSVWKRITADFVGHRDNKEGPFMIKNNNEYQRYFARIDDTYFMEVETLDADSPYSDKYEEKGIVLDGIYLPGHGCLVPSPDGSELWYASHITTDGWETRKLGICPMNYDVEGHPVKATRDLTNLRKPSSDYNGNIAIGKPTNSSSFKIGCKPTYATDRNPKSFWSPNNEDINPESIYLEVDLIGEFNLNDIKVKDLQGKNIDCEVMLSCDRKNWSKNGDDNGFARFVRFQNFKSPETLQISEIEIKRNPYKIISRNNLIGTYDNTSLNDIKVPNSGLYDIEYVLESQSNNSAWNLYDNGNLIATEKAASTGPSGNKTKIISFNVPLTADRIHNFKIVPLTGDFNIEELSIYSLNN